MKAINPPLTPKQKAVLDYLGQFIAERGYPPSFRDLTSYFGLKSETSVLQFLTALEEKGYIERGKGQRHIRLRDTDEADMVEIPLLGRIAAGSPIEPIEAPEPVAVPRNLLPKSGMTYALAVAGDSMIDDGICDGDIILIRHQQTAEDGETIVAITEEGATLKRFYREPGRCRLEPRNPRFQPIYPMELEIRGKFLGLIRRGDQ